MSLKMEEPTSQVHTIETSGIPDLPDSYRAHRLSFHREEYQRTAQIYSNIDVEQEKQRFSLLETCRTRAYFVVKKSDRTVKVLSNACHLRWCPLCSNQRSNFITSQVKCWIKKIKKPKLLTLTLKHSNAPLPEQIRALYKFFRAFRKVKYLKELIHGGIWFFQVKHIEESDEWHPHLHCLIDSEFIPKERLSDIWLQVTKSSFVVDIRSVHHQEKASEYISRYCARPAMLSKLPYNVAHSLVTGLHGVRICGTWGTGRECSLRPQKNPDASEHETIGSFSTVINLAKTFADARAIIKAWQTGISISENVTCRMVDSFIDNIPYENFNIDHFKPDPSFSYP